MEQIIAVLVEKGWPGIIIAVLLAVIWKAWGVIEAKQTRIDDLQEKRMTEALKNIEVVEKNNTIISGLVKLIEDRRLPKSGEA